MLKYSENMKLSYLSILLVTIGGVVLALNVEGYENFVLAMVAMNIIVGVGLNVLLGLSGQISFGHVGFFAIGAYTTAILMLQGVGFWLALLATAAVTGAVGLLLAIPALRVTGPYLAMMTIAFAFIVEHGAIEWRDLTGGSNGLMGFPSPELFGYILTESDLAIFAMVLSGAALVLYQRLAHSTWGRAMRSVRDSEIAAQSIGLNPLVIKTTSFVLSGILTGIAGAVFAPLNLFISPSSFPFFQSILFILAVVVGGTGTLWGPVLGAIVVVLLPELLSDFAEYRLLIFGGLLLGVLWLAPRGIVGSLTRLLKKSETQKVSRSRGDLQTFLNADGPDNPSLIVNGIGISFGGIKAAKDVSFTADPGRVTSIIGPNGAGKTTVLNMIGGFYTPAEGSIDLGRPLAGKPAFEIARAGIARTYQTTQLFEHMSIEENIRMSLRVGKLGKIFSDGDADADNAAVELLLGFVGYSGLADTLAGNLPHVDKRMVEIARALATRPKVLLLDEPAAGLMREDKEQLASLLRKIADAGITLILVEHDMSLVMGISDHIVVLDAGETLMQGTPSEVREDPRVLEAYLGAGDFTGRPRSTPWAGKKVATLNVVDVEAGYGAAPVLQKVRLNVYPGELVAVLGANGAGKSTLLRSISGLHRPVDGVIVLDETETVQMDAHQIAALGMALVPEGRQVFPELTLRDNILLGAWSRSDPIGDNEIEEIMNRFPRIRDRMDSKAGVLSGGEQQMLAIARGLIAKPRILLLDEPSLGLAPAMIAELFDTLADLRDEGVTILIVDQMANLALAVADRGYVMDNGKVVHEGAAKSLKNDPAIEKAYLGHT